MNVNDVREVIEISTQELSLGFPCYEPSIAPGQFEDLSSWSLPISVGGRVWGALNLVSPEHGIDDEDLLLLDAAVAQIGLALQFASPDEATAGDVTAG